MGSSPAGTRHKPLPAPDRVAMIRLQDIFRDPLVNTRELDLKWVEQRVPLFSDAGIGTLVVAERAGGQFSILDGQHRMALLRAAGRGGSEVQCAVHAGITLQEEAGIFKLLNDRRRLTPIHMFLARLTEGDQLALQVAAICERTSWTIGETPKPGVLQCVTKMERIHLNDKARKKGETGNDLERTLRTIVEAWQHDPGTSSADLIGGIGGFFNRYEESVEPGRLVSRLSVYIGGAMMVVLNARGRQALHKGSVAKQVGLIVREEYNKGPGSRLPEWGARK